MPTPFHLRPYQHVDLDTLIGHLTGRPHAALIYCTAAGKSAMMCCAAALLLGSGHVKRVIICAPTNVIKNSLDLNKYDSFECHAGRVQIVQVNDADGGAAVQEYLEVGPDILRTTHLQMSYLLGYFQGEALRDPQFAAGALLIIDEAHRAAGHLDLGAVRELWIRCDGKVLSATATPDRDIHGPTLSEDVPRVERSMPQHMSEGEDRAGTYVPWAPEVIESKPLIVSDHGGICDSEALYAPSLDDYQLVADRILDDMLTDSIDGLPVKAIIRLKSQGTARGEEKHAGSKKNCKALRTLAQTLDAAGLRVYVASGTHDDDDGIADINQKVIQAIREARPGVVGEGGLTEVRDYEKWAADQGMAASLVDVVIGIHELTEGFDWPFCSHAYLLGIPNGLNPTVQVNGRCMRRRYDIAGYPSRWRRTSKLVFVAAGIKKGGKIEKAHAVQMLKICSYLSTFRMFSVLSALNDAFKSVRFTTPEEEQRVRNRINDKLTVPQAKAAEILGFYEKAMQAFRHVEIRGSLSHRHRVALTVAQLESDGETLDTYSRREVRQVLMANVPETRDRFVAGVRQGMAEGLDPEAAVEKAYNQVMDDLLNGDFGLEEGPAGAQVRDLMTITLTGKGIQEVARRLELGHPDTSSRSARAPSVFDTQFRGRL
jgi:hypothetical protein